MLSVNDPVMARGVVSENSAVTPPVVPAPMPAATAKAPHVRLDESKLSHSADGVSE